MLKSSVQRGERSNEYLYAAIEPLLQILPARSRRIEKIRALQQANKAPSPSSTRLRELQIGVGGGMGGLLTLIM